MQQDKNLGTCRLCRKISPLQVSHIIPKFVFRWQKNTAPTQYIRDTRYPNRRLQDGPTERWLCADCEGRFSVWEKLFSEVVFHPFIKRRQRSILYGEWLAKFCVSLSWRASVFHLDRPEVEKQLTPSQYIALKHAEQVWREFLLGERGRVESNVIDLLAIFDEKSFPEFLPSAPRGIHEFFLRTNMIDLVQGSDDFYTIVKIGPFFVFGHLLVKQPRDWRGTRVHFNRGKISDKPYAASLSP
jgi:hypothetical protein